MRRGRDGGKGEKTGWGVRRGTLGQETGGGGL